MDKIIYLGIVLIFYLQCAESKIEEVTGSNIQQLQNRGKFMMIFVTKSGCEECRLVYSKFVAASQPFDPDEIMFGRIQHVGLASQLEVETFPSLIYFKANSKVANRARIDVTVESIIQFISDVTGKDFIYMDKHFTVELTQGNFDEILQTPRQYKLVLLYTNENKDKVEWFDNFAEMYKNDDKVIFCRLDVYLEGNLRGRFKAKVFPALYWYSNDEIPQKSMYGGRFDEIELKGFISDKTGIKREKDGTLPENAGILKDFEDLIRANQHKIAKANDMKEVVKKAKDIAEYYNDKEIANYYVYLLEEVEWHEDTSVIDDERYYLIQDLTKELGPKQREFILKKQSVVRGIMDILGSNMLKRNAKESPIVKKREPRPHVHEHKEQIHRHEEL